MLQMRVEATETCYFNMRSHASNLGQKTTFLADGGPPSTLFKASNNLFEQERPNNWPGRGGLLAWLLRSNDLTPWAFVQLYHI